MTGREEELSYQTTLSGDAQTRVGHYRKDCCTVYIGRGDRVAGGTIPEISDKHSMVNTPIGKKGWIGNPFPEKQYGREQCIERFRTEFEVLLADDPEFKRAVRGLHGEILGCWCQRINDDGPECHGEVIASRSEERR